jgi:transposase
VLDVQRADCDCSRSHVFSPEPWLGQPYTFAPRVHWIPPAQIHRARPGRAAGGAAAQLSPTGQLQFATTLDMRTARETRLEVLRHELLTAARHLTGANVLAARLYGAGPVSALAITSWLAGPGRFSSSRKAVRFAGLDITIYSSGGKPSPGHPFGH